VIELRLRKIEKALTGNPYERMSEEQLNDEINGLLPVVCEGFPSVNAAAEAFEISSDPLDREVAERLGWYIGFVAEERAAGRMQ
jgi:hypothetical protein